jgi:outer membrane protein TolC
MRVLTAQSVALAEERTDVHVPERRMAESVLLIKALGGGWDVSHMLTPTTIDHGSPAGSAGK